MKMLRTPIPNAHLARLEDCNPAELLGRVEYCLKTGSKKTEYGLLSQVCDLRGRPRCHCGDIFEQ